MGATAAPSLTASMNSWRTAGGRQDLFTHLQPLLFPPPGQHAQQARDQFRQLQQAYSQHQSQGQITGKAAAILPAAITALGAALGVS